MCTHISYIAILFYKAWSSHIYSRMTTITSLSKTFHVMSMCTTLLCITNLAYILVLRPSVYLTAVSKADCTAVGTAARSQSAFFLLNRATQTRGGWIGSAVLAIP